MPRALKSESAARKILDAIASGEFRNADAVISKHPEWAAGRELLMQATEGLPAKPPSAPSKTSAQPKARPRGSGPALLSR